MDQITDQEWWSRNRALRTIARRFSLTYRQADERFGRDLVALRCNLVTDASVRAVLAQAPEAAVA